MENLIKKLNLSIDDFNRLEVIEQLISDLEVNNIQLEFWVKQFGEKFQAYGKIKRVNSERSNQVLYRGLLEAYAPKLANEHFDYALSNLIVESMKRPSINEKITKKFKYLHAKISSISIEKFDGDDRKFMEYFFGSIYIGKIVGFYHDVAFLSKAETVTMKTIVGIQVLRGIWRLENLLGEVLTITDYLSVRSLLMRAYILIGVDADNIAVQNNFVSNLLLPRNEEAFEASKLFELLKNYMTRNENFDVKVTMKDVLKRLKLTPVYYEEEVLTNRFLELILNSWKSDVQTIINSLNMRSDEEVKIFFDSIKNVETINEIPDSLQNDNYRILVNNLDMMKAENVRAVLEMIYKFVSEILTARNEIYNNELKFWQTLIDILKNSYKEYDEVVRTLGTSGLVSSAESFKDLLLNTSRATLVVENFIDLQELANFLLDKNVRPKFTKYLKLVADFTQPIKIIEVYENYRQSLEIYGKNVRVADVLVEISKRALHCDEIRFIGMHVLHIDADLSQWTFHGKNIFVLTKIVKVHRSVLWDVSGIDSRNIYQVAGQQPNGTGIDGLDGIAGESGGNIGIIADKIENSIQWSLKSIGGNGSEGQDGGNGEKGRDGITFGRNDNTLEMYGTDEINASHDSEWPHIAKTKRRRSRTDRGTIYEFVSCKKWFDDRYISLIKGADGEFGKNGGKKGLGGEGGHGGAIVLKTSSGDNSYSATKEESKQGSFGIDGKSGFNGLAGANGSDVGEYYHNLGDGLTFCESGQTHRLNLISSAHEGQCVWNMVTQGFSKIGTDATRTYVSTAKSRFSEKTTRIRQQQAIAKAKSPILYDNLVQTHAVLLEDNLNLTEKLLNLETTDSKIKHEKSIQDAIKVKRTVAADCISSEINTSKGKTFRKTSSIEKPTTLQEFSQLCQDGSTFDDIRKKLMNTEIKTLAEHKDFFNELVKISNEYQKSGDLILINGIMERTTFVIASPIPHDVIAKLVPIYGDKISNSAVEKNYEEYKSFERIRIEAKEASQNTFLRELASIDIKLVELFVKSKSQDWALIEFKEAIKNNTTLKSLHEEYLKPDTKFDWSKRSNYVKFQEAMYVFTHDNATSFCRHKLDLKYKFKLKKDERIFNILEMFSLLDEKRKFAALSDLDEMLEKQEIKELPVLGEQEIVDYLNVRPTFESNISDARFGNLKDYFIHNSTVQTDAMCLYVEDLMNSVESNYEKLIHPLLRFMYNAKDSSVISELTVIKEIFQFLNGFDDEDDNGSKLLLAREFCDNSNIKNAFIKELSIDGIKSAAYCSLLAKAFDFSIIFYKSIDGDLEVSDVFDGSTKEAKKMRILFTGSDYLTIALNKTRMKMHQLRLAKDSQYEKILYKFDPRAAVIDIDEYIENKLFDKSIKKPVEKKNFVKEYSATTDIENKLQNKTEADSTQKFIKFKFDEQEVKEFICDSFEGAQKDREKLKLLVEKVSSLVLNNSIILETVVTKFFNDGVHLSLDEFEAVIEGVLSYICNDKPYVNIISWVMSTSVQANWLPEIVLMQVEDVIDEVDDTWKLDLLKKMIAIEQRNVLALLSRRLQVTDEDISLEIFSNIIDVFYVFTLDTLDFLEDLPLNSWIYTVANKYWTTRFSDLFDVTASVEKSSFAVFQLSSLQNEYQINLVKLLLDILDLQKTEIKVDDVLLVFAAFLNKEAILSEKVLIELEEMKLEKWIEAHNLKQQKTNEQRSCQEIAKIIKSGLTEFHYTLTIDEIGKSIEGLFSYHCYKLNKMISDFTKADIRAWKIYRKHSSRRKNPVELLAVIVRAFKLVTGKTLRNTQMMSILIFWGSKGKRNQLLQISTGEGKSWINAAFAIMTVFYGEKVDIITSSNLLAERDATDKTIIEVFALFDISIGHNCNENIEVRTLAYSRKEVIYGSLGNFQRDYLLDKFFKQNLTSGRRHQNVIIDEIDSMMLDKGNNILYLSNNLPDMQEIESVYVFIWQWVNQPTKSLEELEYILDVESIRKIVINEIWGILDREKIEMLCMDCDSETISRCWQSLISLKWVDAEGRILVKTVDERQLKGNVSSLTWNSLQRVLYFIREQNSRLRSIQFPIYLEKFVMLHLNKWIESAIRALHMENERQYIIDTTVGKSTENPSPSPIILDLDTGADQPNSQWDEALHQFLQLKHGCKLSLNSLKSVFISNVSYIKMYNNLFGLSGTLGTRQEQQETVKIFDVEFMTVPAFTPKQFKELEPQLCTTTEWVEKLAQIASEVARNRAVLIIAETIRDVNQIAAKINTIASLKITVLCREADAIKMSNSGKLQKNQVVIATNLAGRGMDLKLSKNLEEAGGLHVLLAYLPTNNRIETQAFGRAARSGVAGTGQLCFVTKNATIYELKQQRNSQEIERLGKVHQYYKNFIAVEEKFFDEFNLIYQSIEGAGKEAEIFKDSFLYNWSFWLDENGSRIEDGGRKNTETLGRSLQEFMIRNKRNDINWHGPEVHRTSKVRYAIHKDNENEVSILNGYIREDPKNSFAEKYYKVFFSLKSSKNDNCTRKDHTSGQVEEMKNVLRMFKDHKSARALQGEMLKPLVQKNIEQRLVQVEGLSNQQLIYDQIDDIFINSIDDLLGQPIHSSTFQNILQNPTEEFLDKLISFGLLKSSRIVDQIPAEKIEEIERYNFVRPNDLFRMVDSRRGRDIRIEDFGQEVAHMIKAPSREEFWKILKNQNVLKDETEYMTFSCENLKGVDPSFLSYISSENMKLKLVDLQKESKKGTFIYGIEENSGDGATQLSFLKSSLYDVYDEKKFARLKQKGCLVVNKLATFDHNKSKSCRFSKFDMLELEDFEPFKIDKRNAESIVKRMLETKVIKKSSPTEYRLNTTYDNLDSFDLKENSVYESKVNQMINQIFSYRIALQKMEANFDANSKSLIIQLPVNPHLSIVSGLIAYHIIDPVKVNENNRENFGNILDEKFQKVLSKRQILDLSKQQILTNNSYDNSFIQHLITQKLVIPIGSDYSYSSRLDNSFYEVCDFDADKTYLNHSYKNVEASVKLLLHEHRERYEKKTEIVKMLKELMPLTMQFDCPELVLKPLDEVAHHLAGTEELEVFKLCGLAAVIQVQEKKTYNFWGPFAVLFIGFFQILAGAVLSILFCGALSTLGSALISEGIGDIVFAIQNFASGYFSWKDYAIQKAFSLGITILTFGIGAYLNKGKSIAGFGYKLFGDSLSKGGKQFSQMVGKELSKEIGLKKLAKEVLKITVKSISKAVLTATVSIGIEHLLEKNLIDAINKLATLATINIDELLREYGIQGVMKNLFWKTGKAQLLQSIHSFVIDSIEQQANIKRWESKAIDVITNLYQTLNNSQTNNVIKFIKNVLYAISILDKVSIVTRLFAHAKIIVTSVETKLKEKDKTYRSKSNLIINDSAWEEAQTDIFQTFKVPIETDVAKKFIDEIVSPLLTKVTNKLAMNAANKAKKYVNYGYERKLKYDFNKSEKIFKALAARDKLNNAEVSLQEKHEKKLMKLSKNTNNPKLMAELIRANIQINMVGVEAATLAIPDILRSQGLAEKNVQIVVDQENGDVHTFGKSGGIVIKLKLENNHFVNENIAMKGNDCLFYALSDKIPQLKKITPKGFRNSLATRVETDPIIRHKIKMGFHKNTMERGAHGGLELFFQMGREAAIKYMILQGKASDEAKQFVDRLYDYAEKKALNFNRDITNANINVNKDVSHAIKNEIMSDLCTLGRTESEKKYIGRKIGRQIITLDYIDHVFMHINNMASSFADDKRVWSGSEKDISLMLPRGTLHLVEKDHIPPKSTYKKGTTAAQRPVTVLLQPHHRALSTTGSKTNTPGSVNFKIREQAEKDFAGVLTKLFDEHRSVGNVLYDNSHLKIVREHYLLGNINAGQAEQLRSRILDSHLEIAKGGPFHNLVKQDLTHLSNSKFRYETNFPTNKKRLRT